MFKFSNFKGNEVKEEVSKKSNSNSKKKVNKKKINREKNDRKKLSKNKSFEILEEEYINDLSSRVEGKIREFKFSSKYNNMIIGEKYYRGVHDILGRSRTVIGEYGEIDTVSNVPNNRIVDNQYKKLVDQKNNYLLGKPVTFFTKNQGYYKLINSTFNRDFMRLIKYIGEDSLNCGIGWLYIYYDDKGKINFKRFSPLEIIPVWENGEHTKLKEVIRVYDYHGKERVEVYCSRGIYFFNLSSGGVLEREEVFFRDYLTYSGSCYGTSGDNISVGYSWDRIPIIPFKYNNKELPLINSVKSLQDGINLITSNFLNNMEEDPRNTILVLVNYDGENLGEFRKNIATYGAVKVRSGSDIGNGDVKTLQVQVNAENYRTIITLLKRGIIENGMGYDGKDDRLGGTPNQMNIKSIYSDIDLDASSMEMEFQASFEEILWFLGNHFYNYGYGNYIDESMNVIFNRDMLMNESEIIDSCCKSVGLISEETIIANHPWTSNYLDEIRGSSL